MSFLEEVKRAMVEVGQQINKYAEERNKALAKLEEAKRQYAEAYYNVYGRYPTFSNENMVISFTPASKAVKEATSAPVPSPAPVQPPVDRTEVYEWNCYPALREISYKVEGRDKSFRFRNIASITDDGGEFFRVRHSDGKVVFLLKHNNRREATLIDEFNSYKSSPYEYL